MLVSLERGALRAVENEEGVDVVRQELDEAVKERAQRGVATAFAGLDLEGPDGGVDCEAEASLVLVLVLEGVAEEGDAFGLTELGEEAGWVSGHVGRDRAEGPQTRQFPWLGMQLEGFGVCHDARVLCRSGLCQAGRGDCLDSNEILLGDNHRTFFP